MKVDYEFIAIGDTVTDAFIEIEEATVEEGEKGFGKKICMHFGEKIPYKDVHVVPAVGNSANASIAASRLGLKSALVTNIGDDYYGRECLEVLKKEKIGEEFIKINKGKATNYHYVLLFRGERTILIKHVEYDYALPDIGSPKWIYLSSMSKNSLAFHSVIEKYLRDHPEVKLAFQPGTYQIKFGKETLSEIYKRADLFFCNKEESQIILGTEQNDIKELLKMMRKTGPKVAVITDGINGAYAYDGGNMWFMPTYPDPAPPLDRTGAGDAFSSTFTSAIALGMDIKTALMWGPINSMSVVQHIGAREGLLTTEKIREYLNSAPADYKPIKLR